MNKAVIAIITFGLVSAFLVFLFLPTFGEAIETQSVALQFIFFNFIVFGLLAIVMFLIFKNHITSLKASIFGTFIVLAIDLNLPDYAVDAQGHIATATALGFFGSSDYAFASLYSSLGIQGTFSIFGFTFGWLTLFVYPITTVILLIIAFAVLGGKKFTEELKRLTSY